MGIDKEYKGRYQGTVTFMQQLALWTGGRFKLDDTNWVVQCHLCGVLYYDREHGYSGPFKFHQCPICEGRCLFV